MQKADVAKTTLTYRMRSKCPFSHVVRVNHLRAVFYIEVNIFLLNAADLIISYTMIECCVLVMILTVGLLVPNQQVFKTIADNCMCIRFLSPFTSHHY